MFKTQYEIWKHLTDGGSVFQKGVEIKFIDGVLKASINKSWNFCPISFENPKLFTRNKE